MRAILESININSNYSLDTISSPVCVYFKITGTCDLNCTFCSQYKEKKCTISIDDAKRVLDELYEMGVVSVNYTGGEPLLYKNLKELLEYGHNLGFSQTIVTNGVHIFDNDDILEYVNTIGISLHGTKNTHDMVCGRDGIYDIVTSNIDKLINNYSNIKIIVNYTLNTNSINARDMNSVLDFCKKREIDLCFGRLNYIGASSNTKVIDPNIYLEIIDRMLETYSKIKVSNCIIPCIVKKRYEYLCHSCGAGQTIYAIEANGDVKICPSSTYVLGNILKNKLSKILKTKELKKFQKLSWLPNVCTLCKKFPSCKGGCHAEGNKHFYKNTCDALLMDYFEKVWDKIKDKLIVIDNFLIKKDNHELLIIKVPIRKINNVGYKVLLQLDGTRSAKDIVKNNKNITNIKEFLITLYIDELVKVI